MGEVLIALFALCVLLVIWTVIGHGMWVVAATILKAIFTDQSGPRGRCPYCGRLSVLKGRCTNCGDLPQRSAPPAPLTKIDDRQAVLCYLEGLLQRGQITPEQHREFQILLALAPPAPSPPQELVDAEIVFLDRAEPTPFVPAPMSVPEVTLRTMSHEETALEIPSHSELDPTPTVRIPHPLDRERPAPTPSPALLQPARSLAEMLQTFLDEKNIRWGEILAGLFIVISAVGLIISLRNTLKAIPYFPALMFMVFTLLFHGAGLYSLRKWNLHAVSRVVLVISLLLVPLSFGAGIVLSGSGEEQRPLADPWVITAILVGLGAFSWVSWSAAKELVDRAPWQLGLAVMGTAVGQIIINRWPVATHIGWTLVCLAVLPLASFLVPLGAAIAWNLPARRMTRQRAICLLLIAGVSLFALLVPLALLLANADDRRRAWADLSPLLNVAALTMLAVGLVLHRKVVAPSLAAWRTAGTSVAILFTMVVLVLLAVAWPRPELLVVVGLLDGALLIALAVAIDFPLLHAGGVAALTIAWLIGNTWLRGALPTEGPVTSRALLSALGAIQSGVALTIWNGLVLGATIYLRRAGQRHALSRGVSRVYLMTAAGVGVVTLLLTANAAFAPWMPANPWPMAASAIFAAYAVAILLAAKRLPHPALPAVATAVAWVALVHLLARNEVVRGWIGLMSDTNVLRLPTLVHACLMAVVVAIFARRTLLAGENAFTRRTESGQWRVFVLPLIVAAVASSLLGVFFEFLPWTADFSRHATALAVVAATWLLLTGVTRRAEGVIAIQLAIHAAIAFAVAAQWSGLPDQLQWFWQAGHLAGQLFFAAILAVLGIALRLSTKSLPSVHRVIGSAPQLDEIVLPAALISLLVVIGGGLGPALGYELGWLKSDAAANGWASLVHQPLAWGTIAAVVIGYALRLWERSSTEALISADALAGQLLALALIPALAAGAWVHEAAAASALRWGLAIFVLLSSALTVAREQLLRLLRRILRSDLASLTAHEVEQLRYFGLALGALPILVITCLAVGTSLVGTKLGGPLPETLFDRLGLNISYGVPLLAVVGSLLLYSVRERESKFALAGSIVFQGAVNLALLLYLKDQKFDDLREPAALSLQINALGSAGYLLVWLGLDCWITTDAIRRARFPRSVDWAIFFLTRLVIVTALWAVAAIVVSPAWQASWDARLANSLSFIALGLNMAIIAWRYSRERMWHAVQGGFALLLSLAALIALAVDCADPAVGWRGFVVLETSWLGLGIVATLLSWWTARRQLTEADPIFTKLPRTLARRGIIVTALAAALAVYGGWDSPWHPWYSLGLIAVSQLCLLVQGLLLQRRWVGYLALPLAIATGVVIWGDAVFPRLTPMLFLWPTIQLLDVVGLSVVVVTLAWLGLEVWLQRREVELPVSGFIMPSMPRVASLLLVLATAAACGMAWAGIPWPKSDVVLWTLRSETAAFVAATGLVIAASLWDRRAVVTFPLLYVWGLAATLQVVAAVNPRLEWALVATLLAIATYLALSAHVWKWGADLAGLGLRLGIHDPVAGLVRVSAWLPTTNLVACCGIAIASVALVLTLPLRDARMATAVAPLLVGWCAASLAQERRKEPLLVVAYLAGVLAAVCLGWADLDPRHEPLFWLVRTIRLLMALGFATLLYGLVVPRWFFAAGDWHIAARRAAGLTAVGAIAALLAVLVQEVVIFQPGVGVPLDLSLIVAVSVVLAGLVIGLISLALLPGRDPLQLEEEGRTYYVYASEIIAALLFVHLYLVRPHFFDVTLRPYWPYILVGLAFASVGIGELFQRSGIRVLGQPLQRSGGLLPLLPALGIWFLASEADNSLVLFLIGLVFLMYCWLRQSLASGLAAAAAGNAALWVWLARDEGRSFLQHPQLWLIPPAVSVLLAAHLQRRRLPLNMLAAIRYTATLVIYLSSTSEMFIQGIGRELWPPMVLALLGVAGAVAGIVLQVRAFLYLGVGFVLLALVSMVAHAAQAIDHVWPWWAFGIGVGLAILVFLGLFEKKRPEIMLLIERLRAWS